jgi:hypothetical protein
LYTTDSGTDFGTISSLKSLNARNLAASGKSI